ncbi:amino-acid N-acetyltransferase [Leucobacter massiliensis]|uniref:N-acetylglutamate synthase n=1 Tax=Leucobacter massiliensis TaxID=1686285 RepID=A0A2S9QSH7_9MICO|nr:amino-acid N-acetyltransferase [Leucobacter massiliensis]PRI12541.1 N-acetylglutamate synthase [Leucobacter massiliensis]PRI12590.1 N-acetylglutamate synthase [Leucobacter massiliensis]
MNSRPDIRIRPARTADVPRMVELMEPLVARRILLGKDLVDLYAAVPEFLVATDGEDAVVGYGAVHVMWDQLGEVRTLGVSEEWLGRGVGHRLLESLEARAQDLGLTQLFCLTFETEFFSRHGFEELSEDTELVAADVYAELLRSSDEGVAEFLDLARVKPNTLGNTRMLKRL